MRIAPAGGHRLASKNTSVSRRRHGAFALFGLVAVVMASLIGLSVLKLALAAQQQARREAQRLQAEWMVESAAARVRVSLASDPAYAGETWSIPGDELSTSAGATVRIARADNVLMIVAEYPADDPQQVRVTRTISVDAEMEP